MTIRLPPDNFLDRILGLFGIKRKIILPNDKADNFNQTPYVTQKTRKEGVFEYLSRILRPDK